MNFFHTLSWGRDQPGPASALASAPASAHTNLFNYEHIITLSIL
jgi:hypothetical protein